MKGKKIESAAAATGTAHINNFLKDVTWNTPGTYKNIRKEKSGDDGSSLIGGLNPGVVIGVVIRSQVLVDLRLWYSHRYFSPRLTLLILQTHYSMFSVSSGLYIGFLPAKSINTTMSVNHAHSPRQSIIQHHHISHVTTTPGYRHISHRTTSGLTLGGDWTGCSSITVLFTASSVRGLSSLRATCAAFRGRPLRRRGVSGDGSEPAGGGGGGDRGAAGWSWWGGSEVWLSVDVSVDAWKLSGPETPSVNE